jgi:hypothetical protein
LLVTHFKTYPQDVMRSRLVLGPNKTFIAITPSRVLLEAPALSSDFRAVEAVTGHNESEKPKNDSKITDAALGKGGAWWLKCSDGSHLWDFAGGYRELERIFRGNEVDHKTINVSPILSNMISYELRLMGIFSTSLFHRTL